MSIFSSSTKETMINKALQYLLGNNDGTVGAEDGEVVISGVSGTVKLPVPPESYEVAVSSLHQKVNIQSLGELNMLGKTGLRTISFTTFLPNQDYTFANAVDTAEYIKNIESLRTATSPCHLLIGGTTVDFDVTIDSFTYSESGGGGDITIALSFSEYKKINEVDKSVVDEKTGLNQRNTTALNKVATNLQYRKHDTPLTFLNRALSKTNAKGLDENQAKYLSYGKSLVKSASGTGVSFNIGDTINFKRNKNNTLSAVVNNKELALKEDKQVFNSDRRG